MNVKRQLTYIKKDRLNWVEKIQSNINNQGYYLEKNLSPLSHNQLDELADQLGSRWQSMDVQAIKPNDNAQFIAQTTEAIPPHNECAYTEKPPRYLLLHCQESQVKKGDFYLVNGNEIISYLSHEQQVSLSQINYRCLVDPNQKDAYPLLRLMPDSAEWYLQYTCIGHSKDWQRNDHYITDSVWPNGDDYHISTLQHWLKQEAFRYKHQWKAGDLLIFDNLRFFHGRDGFVGHQRHLDHIRIA